VFTTLKFGKRGTSEHKNHLLTLVNDLSLIQRKLIGYR